MGRRGSGRGGGEKAEVRETLGSRCGNLVTGYREKEVTPSFWPSRALSTSKGALGRNRMGGERGRNEGNDKLSLDMLIQDAKEMSGRQLRIGVWTQRRVGLEM